MIRVPCPAVPHKARQRGISLLHKIRSIKTEASSGSQPFLENWTHTTPGFFNLSSSQSAAKPRVAPRAASRTADKARRGSILDICDRRTTRFSRDGSLLECSGALAHGLLGARAVLGGVCPKAVADRLRQRQVAGSFRNHDRGCQLEHIRAA